MNKVGEKYQGIWIKKSSSFLKFLGPRVFSYFDHQAAFSWFCILTILIIIFFKEN